MEVSKGSTSKASTGRSWRSEGSHVNPPSSVLYTPEPKVPAKKVVSRLGSTATAFTHKAEMPPPETLQCAPASVVRNTVPPKASVVR
jgi:hypothetical protein